MPWPKTGATHYHAQCWLPDTGCAIKWLVVWRAFDNIIMPIIKHDMTKIWSRGAFRQRLIIKNLWLIIKVNQPFTNLKNSWKSKPELNMAIQTGFSLRLSCGWRAAAEPWNYILSKNKFYIRTSEDKTAQEAFISLILFLLWNFWR